jgi:hypothetical protein
MSNSEISQVRKDCALQLHSKAMAAGAATKQLHDVERQRDELKARFALGVPVGLIIISLSLSPLLDISCLYRLPCYHMVPVVYHLLIHHCHHQHLITLVHQPQDHQPRVINNRDTRHLFLLPLVVCVGSQSLAQSVHGSATHCLNELLHIMRDVRCASPIDSHKISLEF